MVTCAATTREIISTTICISIHMGKNSMMALIDSGSTHNFIHPNIVKDFQLQTWNASTLRVETMNGNDIILALICKNQSFTMGTLHASDYFYVMDMRRYDVISRTKWIQFFLFYKD